MKGTGVSLLSISRSTPLLQPSTTSGSLKVLRIALLCADAGNRTRYVNLIRSFPAPIPRPVATCTEPAVRLRKTQRSYLSRMRPIQTNRKLRQCRRSQMSPRHASTLVCAYCYEERRSMANRKGCPKPQNGPPYAINLL